MGHDLRIVWLAIGLGALALAYQSLGMSGPVKSGDTAYRHGVRDGAPHVEPVTETDCRRSAGGIWVVVNKEPDCLSSIGPPPPASNGVILVFFDGDVPSDRIAVENSPDIRVRYERLSAATSAKFSVPVVIVGRPGLMGSTGVHLNGGRRDEAELLNQAVDVLKLRYGASRVALAGQSGGARIVAQLLVLGRGDVTCTAMASGGYDLPPLKGGGRLATNIFGDPGRSYLVPMQRIGEIDRGNGRRDFIIGDPRDQIVTFAGQLAFATALGQAGHKVSVIEGAGAGSSHHGLAIEGLRAAAACAGGAADGAVKAAALAPR